MKLTADQYYVYFCMFEQPAMFKLLSYSSEFVSIGQSLLFSTDNAGFKTKKHTSRQYRSIYVNGRELLYCRASRQGRRKIDNWGGG